MLASSMLGCNFDHPAFHSLKRSDAFIRQSGNGSGNCFREIVIQTEMQTDIHIAILHDDEGSQTVLIERISSILQDIFLEKKSCKIDLNVERLSDEDAIFLADFFLVVGEIFKNHNDDELRLLWTFMLKLKCFDLIMMMVLSTHEIIGSRFLYRGILDIIKIHSG